jgi:hypothetical protein
MSSSSITRTLDSLRESGYIADIVERRLPKCFVCRDLFGIADLLAVHPAERVVLLIQVTSAGNITHRLERIRARPELPAVLAAGVRVEIWGWAKRNRCWHARRVAIQPGDLTAITIVELPRSKR